MAKKRTVDLSKAANTKQEVTSQPVTQPSNSPTPSTDSVQRHKKGYITSDGVKKYRVSIHLTKEQRQNLKDQAEELELTVTDYLVQKLGL